MKIELVNTNSKLNEALQSFVSKNQLIFNSKAWLAIYPSKKINQCAILNNNNEIIGSFVYYCFQKAFQTFVITPPYAPHIELFCQNPAQSIVGRNTFNKEVADCIANYFLTSKFQYLNLNFPIEFVDSQNFIWKNFNSKNRFTYIIDLNLTEEKLLENLSSEKRKSLNKAAKSNLEIIKTEQLDTVYSLVTKSLARSEKLKNKEILENIFFKFANSQNSFSFVCKSQDQIIAASFCLIHQNKAMYLFGGYDDSANNHGANVACMWASILHAKSIGLKIFDFEGSMNPNIERYFREFGGTIQNYTCIEKVKTSTQLLMNLKGKNPI